MASCLLPAFCEKTPKCGKVGPFCLFEKWQEEAGRPDITNLVGVNDMDKARTTPILNDSSLNKHSLSIGHVSL